MIRRARKASREDAVTGKERSFLLDTSRALASLFIISFAIAPFSFARIGTLYLGPCARITRSSNISFIIRFTTFIRLITILSSRRKEKRVRHCTHQLLRPSACGPYGAIKPGKDRVRASCILNFMFVFTSHAHIHTRREKCSD